MAAVDDIDAKQRADRLIADANALAADGKDGEAARLYVEAARVFDPYASFALVAADTFYGTRRFEDAATAYRIVVEATRNAARHGKGRISRRQRQEFGYRPP